MATCRVVASGPSESILEVSASSMRCADEGNDGLSVSRACDNPIAANTENVSSVVQSQSVDFSRLRNKFPLVRTPKVGTIPLRVSEVAHVLELSC